MAWHLHKSDDAGAVDGITIENARERVAEWRRYYSGRLDNRCKVEIEAYTFLGSRSFGGTLTQPNGNAISFDPTRIADKIIDPLLVPLVAAFCNKMFAADRAYVKGPLDHFIGTGRRDHGKSTGLAPAVGRRISRGVLPDSARVSHR